MIVSFENKKTSIHLPVTESFILDLPKERSMVATYYKDYCCIKPAIKYEWFRSYSNPFKKEIRISRSTKLFLTHISLLPISYTNRTLLAAKK